MISLQDHLNNICNSSTNIQDKLNEIYWLTSMAQVSTTFLGSRVITKDGFAGSVYLDDIAKRLVALSKEVANSPSSLPAERISGVGNVKTLKKFYVISDGYIKNSNFITRFLNRMRELSIASKSTRLDLKRAKYHFLAYSKAHFLKEFGDRMDNCYGRIQCSSKYVAKKSSVLRLIPSLWVPKVSS